MFQLIEELLKKEWEPKDRLIMENLYSSVKTYKRLIPNSINDKMKSSLEICIRLKDELDLLNKNKVVEQNILHDKFICEPKMCNLCDRLKWNIIKN